MATTTEDRSRMVAATEKIDLENIVVQQLVKEAVRMGIQTPLREPILEAVEQTTDEAPLTDASDAKTDASDAETDDHEVSDTTDVEPTEGGKSTTTTVAQGIAVFVTMFVVLYVTLRYLTGGDD